MNYLSMLMDFEYKFNHEGFFGYSLTQDFEYWSLAHFIPLILVGVAIYLTYRYRDRIKAWKGEETLRFALAVVLLVAECGYYWRLLYVGNSGGDKQLVAYLPLEVCEWMAYISAIMMMKKSRHLFDVCFYICLTLGALPFVMPAVIMKAGPGYARYYQFWLEHLIPFFGIFYMMFVHGFKPDFRKVYKPFILLGCMSGLAIWANLTIEGADFMYLANGTDGASIVNIMPENIWLRLLVYACIVIVLFALVSLPQIIREIREHRAKKLATTTAPLPDTVDAPTESLTADGSEG